MKVILLETEFIKLDQFLKLSGVAQTGGHAKLIIVEGLIQVNGETEYRRGRKLRQDDIIEVKDQGRFCIKNK